MFIFWNLHFFHSQLRVYILRKELWDINLKLRKSELGEKLFLIRWLKQASVLIWLVSSWSQTSHLSPSNIYTANLVNCIYNSSSQQVCNHDPKKYWQHINNGTGVNYDVKICLICKNVEVKASNMTLTCCSNLVLI